jgi:hypothetical protein
MRSCHQQAGTASVEEAEEGEERTVPAIRKMRSTR